MKIYFLRHTTLNIADEIFYGQSDVDVSKNFLNEVKLIKSKILSEEIDLEKIKIISSPLKRCKKLAMQIRPKFIGATSARKLSGIKVARGQKAKQVVIQYLLDNEPAFKIEYTKHGNPKPESYDRADAIVIAKAGWAIEQSSSEKNIK